MCLVSVSIIFMDSDYTTILQIVLNLLIFQGPHPKRNVRQLGLQQTDHF